MKKKHWQKIRTKMIRIYIKIWQWTAEHIQQIHQTHLHA